MREIVTSCDRCEKEVHVDGKTIRVGLATWSTNDYDICVDCRAEFEVWIGAPKRERLVAASKAAKAREAVKR